MTIEEMLDTYIGNLADSQIDKELAIFNRIARELKEYFYDNNTSSFINLEKYFTLLYSNPSIEKSIFDKIIDESTIADNASKKLSSLRRNRKSLY
jgi:dsDNA-specific endonuclease/ATPase MutS2